MSIILESKTKVPGCDVFRKLCDIFTLPKSLSLLEIGQGSESDSFAFSLVRNFSRLLNLVRGSLKPCSAAISNNSFPFVFGCGQLGEWMEIFWTKDTGSHSVCRDHELFDDVHGPIFIFPFQIADRFALKYRSSLNSFQTKRPMNVPEILHVLGLLLSCHPQILIKSIYSCDCWRQSYFSIQPCSNAVIGKLSMISDNCPVEHLNLEAIHLCQSPFRLQRIGDPH